MTVGSRTHEPPLPRFVWLAAVATVAAAVWAARVDVAPAENPRPVPASSVVPERSPGGAELFVAAGCSGCHVTVGDSTELGPSLAGALTKAGARLLDPGYAGGAKTAEEYLAEATADHCRDLLPGYRCDGVPDYGVTLTADELASLVHFMAGLPAGKEK